MPNSTLFGSISTNRTSSGFLALISDRIKVFRPTDLPEPVVPATSRWGILARSAVTGSPRTSTPRQSGSAALNSLHARLSAKLAKSTVSGVSAGISSHTELLPGTGSTLTEETFSSRAISSSADASFLILVPAAGSNSVSCSSGPRRSPTTRPLMP